MNGLVQFIVGLSRSPASAHGVQKRLPWLIWSDLSIPGKHFFQGIGFFLTREGREGRVGQKRR
jgi:hypothetical protein